MEISFDYYKTFYYVAKLGSFTKAASELMRGQPNVTKTIANLEAQLDCKLFVRNSRGVTLTPEGEKLYAHVSLAMQSLQAGEQEIVKDRSLQSGVVRIASSEVALRCCLLPALEQFRKQYPHVRIKLSNYSTPQAIDALKNGLADFAVVTATYQMPQQLSSRELLQMRLIPVCGKGYANLTEDEVTLAQLQDYPMVCMNPTTTTFHLLQTYFAQNGVTLAPDIEVATADQLLPLIRSNLGWGFVPEGFLTSESNIHALKLKEPSPEQTICLFKRMDMPLSIAAKKMEQMLI